MVASKRAGVAEVGPQLLVVAVDDRGDRVGAGVGADHAGDEPGAEAAAEAEVLVVVRAVEAGEVDDARRRRRSRGP